MEYLTISNANKKNKDLITILICLHAAWQLFEWTIKAVSRMTWNVINPLPDEYYFSALAFSMDVVEPVFVGVR